VKALVFLTLSATVVYGQDGFPIGSADSPFRVNVRPSIEATLWAADQPSPALLDLRDDAFFGPRLSLAVDATAGSHWFFSANARLDRGFDPGEKPDGDIRLDELIMRWRPFDDQRLNLQIGKFPTFFGAWPAQHDFFDDPFLVAPLPYSQIIGINTRNPAAISPAAISARANGTGAAFSSLRKDQWGSMLWGPSYTSGAAAFGATEHLDYALEVKNAALSSHPDSWSDLDFNHPTLTARLGYRPDAAWSFGLSGSRGSWLETSVPGLDHSDLMQNTLGLDMRWSHHDLILSGEVILSEFETPAAGDLRTASWFVQARWKAAPGFWLAARFGQIFANDATGVDDRDVSWQPDVWRAELGAGWRINPHMLVKADYSYTHADGDPAAGNHLFGAGFGWQF
jgi:opacity protein-like surface antigen